MNPSDPHPSVSQTLAEWRLSPTTDPQFRPAVWQRIQRRSGETWTGYVRAHLIGWSVAGGLAVVAAGWTGHSLAQANLNTEREQMAVSYLGNLDPRVLAKIHGPNP